MTVYFLQISLMRWAKSFLEVWRNGRKLMHHFAMPSAATSYQPTQLLESSRLVYNLIKEPEKYEKWFELYASGLIFRLAFGEAVESDDLGLKRIQDVVGLFSNDMDIQSLIMMILRSTQLSALHLLVLTSSTLFQA